MKRIELYCDKKDNRYYFTGFAVCANCKEIVTKIVVLVSDSKKKLTYQYCLRCISKIQTTNYMSIKRAIMTERPPLTCVPVLREFFELSYVLAKDGTAIGNWEAAKIKMSPEKVPEAMEDKRIRQRDFMIQGDAKDKLQIALDVAQKDAVMLLNNDTMTDLLDSYLHAQPLLEMPDGKPGLAYERRKEIEDKSV